MFGKGGGGTGDTGLVTVDNLFENPARYIYIYKSVRLISVKQCSIHVSRAEYKVEKKIQTDYTFISTSLFRGCPLS